VCSHRSFGGTLARSAEHRAALACAANGKPAGGNTILTDNLTATEHELRTCILDEIAAAHGIETTTASGGAKPSLGHR
jgi:hypothetical protein